jgi:cell shape-determining protein MreC
MARPTPTYTPVRNYAIGFSLSLLLLFSDINYGTFTPLRGFLHASTLYAQMISKGVFENISMTLTSIQKNKSLIQENKELRDQILQIRTKDFIFRKNNETNTQIINFQNDLIR